jgi:hypothetical protein
MEKKQSRKTTHYGSLLPTIKIIGYSILLLLMILGTYLFSLKDQNKYVIPFTLISYTFFLIMVFYIINVIFIPITISNDNDDSSRENKKDRLKLKLIFSDLFTMIFSWLFWLIYGIVFKDISTIYGNAWVYVQTLILLLLVILSYIGKIIRNVIIMWTLIITFFVIALFFPSKDSISYTQNGTVLMTKVIMFYILYIINDYRLKIPDLIISSLNENLKRRFTSSNSKVASLQGFKNKLKNLNESNGNNNNSSNESNGINKSQKKLTTANLVNEIQNSDDFDIESQTENTKNDSKSNLREKCLRMKFVALMRAFWVLSSSKYLIVLSLIQILPILMLTYLTCINNTGNTNNNSNLSRINKTKQKSSPNNTRTEDNDFDLSRLQLNIGEYDEDDKRRQNHINDENTESEEEQEEKEVKKIKKQKKVKPKTKSTMEELKRSIVNAKTKNKSSSSSSKTKHNSYDAFILNDLTINTNDK